MNCLGLFWFQAFIGDEVKNMFDQYQYESKQNIEADVVKNLFEKTQGFLPKIHFSFSAKNFVIFQLRYL